jgi:FkbM family methyltransferase
MQTTAQVADLQNLGGLATPPAWFEPGILTKLKLQLARPERRAVKKSRLAQQRFYSRLVRPGELAFDVGANIGARTGMLLNLGCRVLAVEPQPACVAKIREKYKSRGGFLIEQTALGAAVGKATLHQSATDVLGTLSTDWMERMRESGRFAGTDWSASIEVPVTTMDSLIAKHGTPALVKIDVEGFEEHVLAGLSTPIRCLSLEFAREFLDHTHNCVKKLATLADYAWNYGVGDHDNFALSTWIDGDAMIRHLSTQPDAKLWGDVYAIDRRAWISQS